MYSSSNVSVGDTGMIGQCIHLIQETIPNYYDNMTYAQCVAKMDLGRMWMKTGTVSWTVGVPEIKVRVALAFYLRQRFTAQPYDPQYYMSVGIGDTLPANSALDAAQVATAIRAACAEFNTGVMSPHNLANRLFIGYSKALDLSFTRLGDIFNYADGQGWLGASTDVRPGMANDPTKYVWPTLATHTVAVH